MGEKSIYRVTYNPKKQSGEVGDPVDMLVYAENPVAAAERFNAQQFGNILSIIPFVPSYSL